MSAPAWLLAHHVVTLLLAVLTVAFSPRLFAQRRPTGSAFAWLLALLFIPYLGIPLYLVFGGRKFRRKAGAKACLPASTGPEHDSSGALTWLDDGVLAFEAFHREILAARRSIRLVTFVLGDDASGRALLGALIQRAREGLEVRLLLDDLLRFHAPRAMLGELVAAGGRVERFMPLLHVPFRGRANLRNHRKIALFDGQRAIVGGMNLASEYMGPAPLAGRWRDLSLLVEGPAVPRLDSVFCADWLFASGEALAPAQALTESRPSPVRVVPCGPDAPQDALYDAVLTAVFRAEKRFWIATPYFVPDEPLVGALAVAARRGVDVRVVVPARSNHRLADLAAAPLLRELEEAGVTVRRYLPGMLHAKAMLVDDALAVVGSANFDMRSLFLDYEIALFLTGEGEVARLSQWFERTMADTAAGVPRASWTGARVEVIARLVAPLL